MLSGASEQSQGPKDIPLYTRDAGADCRVCAHPAGHEGCRALIERIEVCFGPCAPAPCVPQLLSLSACSTTCIICNPLDPKAPA